MGIKKLFACTLLVLLSACAGVSQTYQKGQIGVYWDLPSSGGRKGLVYLTPTMSLPLAYTLGTNTFSIGGLSTFGTGNFMVGVKADGTSWEYKSFTVGSGLSLSHGVGTLSLSALLGTGNYGDSTVTGAKLARGHVVRRLNNLTDNIRLVGAGGATITDNGIDTITITAGGGGGGSISALQNTDGSVTLVNPTGPTVTVSVAANGIDSNKIAPGQVTTTDAHSDFRAPYSTTAYTPAGSWNPPSSNNYDLGSHGSQWRGVYGQRLYLSNGGLNPAIVFRDQSAGLKSMQVVYSGNQLFFRDSANALNTLLTLNDSLNTVGVRAPASSTAALRVNADSLANNTSGTAAVQAQFTRTGSVRESANSIWALGYLRNSNDSTELSGHGAFLYADTDSSDGSIIGADDHVHRSTPATEGTRGYTIGGVSAVHSEIANSLRTYGHWIWTGNHSTVDAAKSIAHGLLISGGQLSAGGFNKAITYKVNNGSALDNGTTAFQVDSLGWMRVGYNASPLYPTLTPLVISSATQNQIVELSDSQATTLSGVSSFIVTNRAATSGTQRLVTELFGTDTSKGTGRIAWQLKKNDADANPTTVMTLKSTGNLGLGTEAPNRALTISRASANAGITLISSGGSGLAYKIESSTGGSLDVSPDNDATPNLRLNGAGNYLSLTSGNFGLGTASFGTSAANVVSIGSGTAPTSSPADVAQEWVRDINGVAGQAGLHMRNEINTSELIIPGVRYRSAGGNPVDAFEGMMVINTTDSTFKVYAQGAWRTLKSYKTLEDKMSPEISGEAVLGDSDFVSITTDTTDTSWTGTASWVNGTGGIGSIEISFNADHTVYFYTKAAQDVVNPRFFFHLRKKQYPVGGVYVTR